MPPESFSIFPRLLSIGEPVTIRLTSEMDYVPLTLEMTPQYLEQEFTVGEGIRVDWDETGAVKQGVALFTPEQTGSYLVRFGETFRTFAVVDETYTVCTLSIPFSTGPYPRGNQLDLYHPDVHPRHIPVDYVVLITDEKSLSPAWDVHKTLRAFHRIAGDAIVPYLDHRCAAVLASRVSSTLSGMPEEEALAVLYHLKTAWQKLGYGPLGIVHASSPGYGFVRGASQQGITGIGGLGGEAVLKGELEDPRPSLPENLREIGRKLSPVPLRDGHLIGLSWPLEDGGLGWINPRRNQTEGIDPVQQDKDLDIFLSAKAAGPRLLSVLLDGDAFDVIDRNRSLISRLIDKTRDHHLVFALSEDVVRFVTR